MALLRIYNTKTLDIGLTHYCFFQSLDSNIMSSTRLGGTSPQIQLHITRDSLEDQTDETQESPHAKIVA